MRDPDDTGGCKAADEKAEQRVSASARLEISSVKQRHEPDERRGRKALDEDGSIAACVAVAERPQEGETECREPDADDARDERRERPRPSVGDEVGTLSLIHI